MDLLKLVYFLGINYFILVEGRSFSLRITNGETVEAGQYPFMAYIQTPNRRENPDIGSSEYCGGSVISQKWILTSAQCVTYDDTGDVIESATVYLFSNLPLEGDAYRSETIIPHEDYNKTERLEQSAFVNDIALIKLEKNIDSPNNDPAIILADKDSNFDGVTSVLGWGEGFEPFQPQLLRLITLMNTPSYQCDYNSAGPGTLCYEPGYGFDFYIKTPSPSDLGSPVFVENGDQNFTLIGIYSYVYFNGTFDLIVVFQDVAYFADWIDNTMNDN